MMTRINPYWYVACICMFFTCLTVYHRNTGVREVETRQLLVIDRDKAEHAGKENTIEESRGKISSIKEIEGDATIVSTNPGQADKKVTMESTTVSPSITSTQKEKKAEEKLVLFYNKFYGSDFKADRYTNFNPKGCTYKCRWTNNKSELNRSDAVMFSIRNWAIHKDLAIKDLPARNNPNQLWAMIIKEPQAFFQPDQLKMLNNKFNLSVTFQRDSDVTIPHGRYLELTPAEAKARSNMQFTQEFKRPKILSWIVSNCFTSSKRETYVNELIKYITIDKWGACTGTNEWNYNIGRGMLARKYKFYLAFENSDCDDYVTEKFWETIQSGLIPVVRGKRVNYTLLAPPNSFVHADRFKSAQDLANHLKEASRNETLFNTYHEWRRRYKVEYSMFSTNRRWVCDFCEKVYQTKHQQLDMYEHFSPDTRCYIHAAPDDPSRKKEHIQNLNP